MNLNFLHKDQEAMQMSEMLVRLCLKHCSTNGNHAIPSVMSGFITELLTLAVYCYFLLSLLELYKDREATQMLEMLLTKILLNIILTCVIHTI